MTASWYLLMSSQLHLGQFRVPNRTWVAPQMICHIPLPHILAPQMICHAPFLTYYPVVSLEETEPKKYIAYSSKNSTHKM